MSRRTKPSRLTALYQIETELQARMDAAHVDETPQQARARVDKLETRADAAVAAHNASAPPEAQIPPYDVAARLLELMAP